MGAQRKVIVYGASGHGKVVMEIVRASGLDAVGFVDDGAGPGTAVLGLPVLGDFAWLERERPDAAVVPAIGVNATRQKVCERLRGAGFELATVVHPRAWVSPSAQLGAGTVVMAGVAVNAEARVGLANILNTACVVEHDCRLGDYVHVSPNAALGGGTTVGDRTHVGIGASVRHLATIGSDCVIGAGAVVLDAVEPGVTAVGVPARRLR